MNRDEKIELAKCILSVIGNLGVLTVAVLAPNAVQMFARFYKDETLPKKFNSRFNRAVHLLDKKGLIMIHDGKAKLTPLGERELMLYQTKRKMIEKPKKWDGKWRIVMFDIWEKRRAVRDAVRSYLRQLGFVCLQRSVWVFPYDCKEVVSLLKTYYRVQPALLYMTIERMEDDKFLRQKFGLKD